MSKIKKVVKAILWGIFPKKNGVSSLKVLNGPAKGIILNLDMRLEGSYWLGNYDKWIFDDIDFNEYIKPGNIVWDGGAYVGYYTACFRKLIGNTGQVHSFEASITNYNRLIDLPKNNKWDNVFIHNLAIGPEHSEISFVDNLGGSNGPYGLDKVYNKNKNDLVINKVMCSGVDELINERDIPVPDFIKFDLESAEEFALHNGDKLFKEKRPIILLELHGIKAKQSAGLFLEKYNYEGILVGSFKKRETVVHTLKEFNNIEGVPHMIVCLPL